MENKFIIIIFYKILYCKFFNYYVIYNIYFTILELYFNILIDFIFFLFLVIIYIYIYIYIYIWFHFILDIRVLKNVLFLLYFKTE